MTQRPHFARIGHPDLNAREPTKWHRRTQDSPHTELQSSRSSLPLRGNPNAHRWPHRSRPTHHRCSHLPRLSGSMHHRPIMPHRLTLGSQTRAVLHGLLAACVRLDRPGARRLQTRAMPTAMGQPFRRSHHWRPRRRGGPLLLAGPQTPTHYRLLASNTPSRRQKARLVAWRRTTRPPGSRVSWTGTPWSERPLRSPNAPGLIKAWSPGSYKNGSHDDRVAFPSPTRAAKGHKEQKTPGSFLIVSLVNPGREAASAGFWPSSLAAKRPALFF
mmetsp:Transcript_25026/g.56309  ORF Transcript_25026/g.56309 Transcript_25026/m.56309 type:complete len:272 (+) Transcript_25026:346-1161(+)